MNTLNRPSPAPSPFKGEGWGGGQEVPDHHDPLLHALRREFNDCVRRLYWYQRHAANGSLLSQRRRAANQLARQGEDAAAEMIRALGYQAYPTTHKCPFDLWVSDDTGRAARIEVKTSIFHPPPPRAGGPGWGFGRYQINIRQHKDVDLVVFLAKNGDWWPYVLPIQAIGKRRNIAIWSECPADYTGRWQIYLNAWQHLEQVIANSQPRSWQLILPLPKEVEHHEYL